MSQATDILGVRWPSYVRVVGAVSAAHFVSHYYIILLAPLLPFVRAYVAALQSNAVCYRGALAFDRAIDTNPAGYAMPSLLLAERGEEGRVYPSQPVSDSDASEQRSRFPHTSPPVGINL